MRVVSTLGAFLDEAAARGGCIVEAGSGRRLDCAELAARATRVAAALHRLGLRRGDRLALLLPNTIDWFVLHAAAARLGVLTVPLNTRYTRTEIRDLLRVSEARAIAVDPDFHGLGLGALVHELAEVDGVPLDLVISTGTTGPGIAWQTLLDHPDTDGLPPDVDGGAPLVVFGTSGTTSAPKLALHHHDGVTTHAVAVAAGFGLGGDDVVLGMLPPCGAYGYTVALAALTAGARLVLLPSFTPAELAGRVADLHVTFFAATEAILRPALAAPDALERLSTWRIGATAGGSVGDVVARLGEVGTTLVNVYGASEVLALFAIRDPAGPADARSVPGGSPVHDALQVRVGDIGTGAALPPGSTGELQFRGYSVFSAYLANPEATAAAFTADGWFRSGDHGRVAPDGRSFDYLSRLTDTMRLRGFLVDPAQIEEVLLAHPAVRQAQVVGVPSTETGEEDAVAFVVGDAVTEAELRVWSRERLAAHKVPSRVAVVEEIPTTPSANGDKALKRVLRHRAARLLEEST